MFSRPVNKIRSIFTDAHSVLSSSFRIFEGTSVKNYFTGAAIASPFIFSSENRDPLETALVTTPLVATAFAAAPAARDIFLRNKQTSKAMWNHRKNLHPFIQDGDIHGFMKFKAEVPKEMWKSLQPVESAIESKFYSKAILSPDQAAARSAERTLRRLGDAREYFSKVMALDDADPQLQSALASFKEATIASKDSAFLTDLEAMELQSGTDAKALIRTQMEKFLPEGGEANTSFLAKLNQRIKQSNRLRTFNDKGKAQLLSEQGKLAPELAKDLSVPVRKEWATLEGKDAVLGFLDKRGGHYKDVADKVRAKWTALETHGFRNLTLRYDEASNNPIGLVLDSADDARNSLHVPLMNTETGKIWTGKDFTNRGVGSRLLRVDPGNRLTSFLPDEFALEYATGGMSREQLQQNLQTATKWQNRGFQSDMKDVVHGDFATKNFSTSGVLIDADAEVHWAPGEAERVRAKRLQHSQILELAEQRIKSGEFTSSGTGAASKFRFYEKRRYETINRLDKPSSTDVTIMKEWELVEDLPSHLKPNVVTAQLAEDVQKFGNNIDRFVRVTASSASPTGMEYFGQLAAIADRKGVLLSELEWQKKYIDNWNLHNAQDKITRSLFKQRFDAHKDRYYEFIRNQVHSAFDANSYTSPAEKKWWESIRADMQKAWDGSVSGTAPMSEEAFFRSTVKEFASNKRLLMTANQIGMGGGEGQALIDKKAFSGVQAWRHSEHSLSHLSKDVEDAWKTGKTLPENFFLGYSADPSLSPVTVGRGKDHVITNVQAFEKDGRTFYNVETALKENVAGRNIKLAMGGVKTTNVTTDMSAARRLLNRFNKAVGSGIEYSDDVNVIMQSTAGPFKFSNSFEELIGLSDQILREAAGADNRDIWKMADETLGVLKNEFGVNYDKSARRYVIDTAYFDRMAAQKFSGKSQYDATVSYGRYAIERLFGTNGKKMDLSDAQKASEDLVKEFGIMGRLEAKMLQNESDLKASGLFRQYRKSGMGRFSDYLSKYHAQVSAGVMESSTHKFSRQDIQTEDFLRELSKEEMFTHARDLMARSKAIGSGDARQTAQVLAWYKGGEYHKPMDGKTVVGMDDAHLIRSRDTSGTLLDWRRNDLQDVFFYKPVEPIRMQVADGVEHVYDYIAAPGYEGFGMKPNMYRGGLRGADTPLNKSWKKFMSAEADFKLGAPGSDKTRVSAFKEYQDALGALIGGKKGLLRTRRFDPLAFSGTPQKVVTGSMDAFDVFLSPGDWKAMKDNLARNKDLKSVIDENGFFYATHKRHPINAVHYVRVRQRRGLGANQFGISDYLRQLTRGDFDLDPGALNPVSSVDAWKEAHEQVSDLNSRQWVASRERNLFRNLEQNINLSQKYIDEYASKNFVQQALKNLKSHDEQIQAVKARMTGRYIGHFSHLVTRFQLGWDKIPGVGLDDSITDLMRSTLKADVAGQEGAWAMRQMAIALQKQYTEKSQNPVQVINEFMSAWEKGGEEGADRFVKLVKDAVLSNKEHIGKWTEEHQARWGQLKNSMTGQLYRIGEEGNILHDVIDQYKPAEQSLRNIITEGRSMTDAVVDGADRLRKAENAFRLKTGTTQDGLWSALSQIDSAEDLLATDLSHSGMRMADKSASDLGKILDSVKNAAGKEMKSVFRPAGKVALAGGIALGAAGLVLGGEPDAMKGAARVARSRPEEQMGQSDAIPGAPETGSMSHNPAVDVQETGGGVNRAVVAPIHRTSNASVTVQGPDPSIAGRVRQKLLEGLSGGPSFVTENHIGGWRERSGRLHAREQIREDLERY